MSMSHEWTDAAGFVVVNDTHVPNSAVMQALARQEPEMAALVKWTTGTSSPTRGRAGGLFDRDRYVTPTKVFDQFYVARSAVENDDVVGGVLETLESLAFSKMSFETEDEDEEDIWNQIAADIDFDSRMREMWRELYTVSQFYCAIYWGRKDYTVRGKSEKGVKRKKTFKGLRVPLGLTLLDPTKVVPVGNFMFNKEQLVYIADINETAVFDKVLSGEVEDPIVQQMIVSHFEPSEAQRQWMINLGVPNDIPHLFALNPQSVFRHTATRAQFQHLASVRLASLFDLLDLKTQLKEMDRAHLVGGPLRLDQRVVTPEGWKPIGTVIPGDVLFGPDGGTTRVLGVYPQGVLDLQKITFTDGTTVTCDTSHRWNVIGRRGHIRTMTLAQILEEGLFDSNGPRKRLHRHRVVPTAALDLPEVVVPLSPYLLGYLLGDGSLSQSIPKITTAEVDDLPWVDLLPTGVTITQYEMREGFAAQYGLKGPRWRYNPVTQGLRDLGLDGAGCADKFIPEVYLRGSIEQRKALLEGLLDSDGSYHSPGCVEFGSVSEKLADGVVELVQSLGGVAKTTARPPLRKAVQTFFRVFISLPKGFGTPFRLRRKVAKWQERKHDLYRAIDQVERSLSAEAVCIAVDHPSHLFLTEGMIATHNTNFIVLVKKGSDQRPGTPQEVAALSNQVKVAARVPVIVGDHRLSVEIITPKQDFVLDQAKYDTLDTRIGSRLLQMFVNGGTQADDSPKLARIVAAGMESRRHMIRRSVEQFILKPCTEANDEFSEMPTLAFHPRRIALTFDSALAAYLIDLRDRGEISRETILAEFDYSQGDEANKRKREKADFDEIFQTIVPFSGNGGMNGNGTPTDPAQPPRAEQPKKDGQPNKTPLFHNPIAQKQREAQQQQKRATDPRTGGRNRSGTRTTGSKKSGGAAPGTQQGKSKEQQ